MIELANVSASYGALPAITGVTIRVGPGEAVGLLGANGAGKSTTLRAISGLVKLTAGSIAFMGQDLTSLPAHKIAELGIAHVPEGRQVFPEMTVNENLEVGSYTSRAKADRKQSLDLVYSIFPRLAERRTQLAGTMSGGEQQMLAMGRALMARPKVLLLDEPTMGLSPIMCDKIFEVVQTVASQGVTILLVEQNANMALNAADHGYVLENGRIVMEDSCERLREKEDIKEFYLGVKDDGVRGERRWKKKKTWR